MRKITVFFLFFAIFCTLSAWDEFNQYSIADELKKPGVKLVAVDFYATWCEPCNAAIPKWKKLQEKYGDKGFKLIVVSVQSEGSCSQPPQWNPDKIVCDYDGDIADAWHANDLPQAFLWSWQGNLLVAHGGVDNVAAAIEQYFKKTPRVYVEEGSDKNIYQLVRSKLRENSKIEIVASDAERKALAELRKKSSNMNYDTKLQCKLGEEISANSRLVISKQKRGKKDALVLELFSVEKGCLTASGTATMHGNIDTEVAEAVYNLLKNLLGSVSMPGEGGVAAKPKSESKLTQNSQDKRACEYAKKEENIETWETYLEKFPNGECAFEAETKIKKLKKNIANIKEDENETESEQKRLKEEKRKAEAEQKRLEEEKRKAEVEQKRLEEEKRKAEADVLRKKKGILEWSNKAPHIMNGYNAVKYCENLNEGGHNDWRLPNIDELRTLIQNCPQTETGMQCKVSEKNGCLSSSCGKPRGSCYCQNTGNGIIRNIHTIGYFSKLGDDVALWSSSTNSDYKGSAWFVNFAKALVGSYFKTSLYDVRCVR